MPVVFSESRPKIAEQICANRLLMCWSIHMYIHCKNTVEITKIHLMLPVLPTWLHNTLFQRSDKIKFVCFCFVFFAKFQLRVFPVHRTLLLSYINVSVN